MLTSSDPFGIGEHLTAFQVESYAPFPFLPPVEPGAYGSVYEFRTYHLKVGAWSPRWPDGRPRCRNAPGSTR
ncbi:hypothetical protein NKH77_47730 [Streptomyces sp. M19]